MKKALSISVEFLVFGVLCVLSFWAGMKAAEDIFWFSDQIVFHEDPSIFVITTGLVVGFLGTMAYFLNFKRKGRELEIAFILLVFFAGLVPNLMRLGGVKLIFWALLIYPIPIISGIACFFILLLFISTFSIANSSNSRWAVFR